MKFPLALRLAAGAFALFFGGCTAFAAVAINTTPVDFGNYVTLDTNPDDTNATITMTCSGPSITFTATLSTGDSGSYTPRTMHNGTDTITYNLYKNASRTQIFGNGTGGTADYANIPCNNQSRSAKVYGRIPAGQDVPAGSYTDTITITVNY